MSPTTDTFPHGGDGVVIPRLWVTIALSMLVHALALWGFPERPVLRPDAADDRRMPLSLQLMPPEPPAPVVIPVPPRPAPEAAPRLRRPQAVPRPLPAPPVIALDKPAAAAPPAVEIRPAPPRADGDFAAYVEARRRQRGASEPPPPVDADEARRQRIIAGNLATQRNLAFGYDPNQGGGVFQIERLGYDHAEFIFYGWNRDIRRNTKQLIEVRKGEHADIRIAVVRRMVAIIREYEEEDFLWVSQRLGRSVMLSARPRDRAGLEDFMMREFFSEPAPAQR
jgi:hypothetical protein